MKPVFYALKYNKTRQVQITTDEVNNIEVLRLYVNGAPYSINQKAGGYVGCGIDAAHSFMGYFINNIPRSKIKKYVDVTSGPSDFRKYAAKIVSLGFWDTKDEYFTTPAKLAVGLDKLTIKNLKARKKIENDTIRHNKGTHSSILQKIRHHLRRAMPVVALIKKGNHWVTIVGMECKYKNNGEIDVNNTTITYLDLTKGYQVTNKAYKDLKILGWSSYWGRQYASSYVHGTLVSLKSDSVHYSNKWSKGWNSKIFEVGGKQYLFLLKWHNGLVHIHKMKPDGSVGEEIADYDWSKGWSNFNFFTVKNNTYLFLMKAGKGDGYTNGLVHINKVNNNGTIGKVIDKHDWRSGWKKIEFFYLNDKTYVILNRDNGLVNIREMNSNGTIGRIVINTKNFLKNTNHPFLDTDIQVLQTKEAIYIYGINHNGEKTIYSQYKFYMKNSKFQLDLVDKRVWTAGWLRLNIFKDSNSKAFFIISKGIDRNGIMHVHEIDIQKNDAKLGKLIDDNYFRNKFTIGTMPTERWSNIQYFKARNKKLKLFLLDKYNGRVRILNMKDTGAFEDDLVLSKQLKFYHIEMTTSNIKKAGTSAKVFITLKGDNWTSPEYHIDTICDDFEKGSLTIQDIPVSNYFGEIKKVMIRHDNSNSRPGWHLEKILIKEGTNKNTWYAKVNQWFAKTTGDKKIKREISLSKK